jgi:regulator of sigma E protease
MLSFLIFVGVLSLLIFVHELGHFLAAKACNIYCDQFSIGMPPRVFGFKWGETDYCIGALPLGGYVKMAGQEDAPLSEEEREQTYGHVSPERFFNNKPVYQRIFVLLAGPFMNLLLAFLIYLFIAARGAEVPVSEIEARIGMIGENTPALTAPLWLLEGDETTADTTAPADATGWKTGDLLLTMNGSPIKNIRDVAMNGMLKGDGTPHTFLLQREESDGTTRRYFTEVAPKKMTEEDEYPRIGVAPYDGALVKELLPGAPGEQAGLQPNDLIVRINAQPVDRATFIDQVEKVPEGESLTLTVKRGEALVDVSIAPRTLGRMNEMYTIPHFNPVSGEEADAVPVIASISKEFAESSGLQPKDRIIEVNGQPATAKLFYESERDNPGGSMAVKIERPAVLFGLLRGASTLEATLPIASVRAVGVTLGSPTIFDRAEPAEILPRAWQECSQQVGIVVSTLRALFTATVSVKELGGPVMIAQVTMQAAQMGWEPLFRTTAFISLNLFILNLLPLPVLDGGQIVLNLVEGIRRKPLSLDIQGRIQMVGVVMIIALMLFVTWNDVSRLSTGLLTGAY